MDKWTPAQIKRMQVGGNQPCREWFEQSAEYDKRMSIPDKVSPQQSRAQLGAATSGTGSHLNATPTTTTALTLVLLSLSSPFSLSVSVPTFVFGPSFERAVQHPRSCAISRQITSRGRRARLVPCRHACTRDIIPQKLLSRSREWKWRSVAQTTIGSPQWQLRQSRFVFSLARGSRRRVSGIQHAGQCQWCILTETCQRVVLFQTGCCQRIETGSFATESRWQIRWIRVAE